MTHTPMVLADPNRTDCPVVYCNDAFCAMTGYGRAATLGRNLRFLQGPDTDLAVVRRIAEALAGHQHVEEEIFNYRRDGQGIWLSVHISPVFDADGTLRYFFGSQLDITHRRKAERLQARHIGPVGWGDCWPWRNLGSRACCFLEKPAPWAAAPSLGQGLEP
jgi:PAS domain S-box-containing protein